MKQDKAPLRSLGKPNMVIAALLAICAFQGFYGVIICQFFPQRAHTLGGIMFWLGGFTAVLAVAAYRGDMLFKNQDTTPKEDDFEEGQ